MNQHTRLKRRMARKIAGYRASEYGLTIERMFKRLFVLTGIEVVVAEWDVENQRWIWPEVTK